MPFFLLEKKQPSPQSTAATPTMAAPAAALRTSGVVTWQTVITKPKSTFVQPTFFWNFEFFVWFSNKISKKCWEWHRITPCFVILCAFFLTPYAFSSLWASTKNTCSYAFFASLRTPKLLRRTLGSSCFTTILATCSASSISRIVKSNNQQQEQWFWKIRRQSQTTT